jgi:hypothetical protein
MDGQPTAYTIVLATTKMERGERVFGRDERSSSSIWELNRKPLRVSTSNPIYGSPIIQEVITHHRYIDLDGKSPLKRFFRNGE